MKIAKNVGTVTLSRCHPSLHGSTLRCVHLIDDVTDASAPTDPSSDLIVAWDLCASGEGSVVLLAEGPEAAQPFRPETKPLDASLVAIVDEPLSNLSRP